MKKLMVLKSFLVSAALACGVLSARADWRYLAKGDEGNPYDYGIVTDGNWVIKVSGKTATYFTTASGVGQFVAGSGKLDVVQMESDLGIEWRLGSNATSVDYQKFKGVTAFTEVVLPARITTFSNETFAGCTNLIRFDAPGVTPLTNTGYFDGCTSLTTLSENFIHPNGNIGQTVLNNCSSLAVDFVCGPNVTSLGWHAFYKSGITSIDMSKANVSSVGNSFNDCPNLDKVILSVNCTAISGDVCLVDPTQVYATGPCLTSVAWHSLGATNYRVRFFVDPVIYSVWTNSTIAGATVNAVTDTDRASSYYSEYGLAEVESDGRLLGVWAPGSGGKIWLIMYQSPYNPSQAERGSLMVATEPEGVGTASPAVNTLYTRFSLDDGARQTCTASANAVKDSDAYKLNGYRLEKWVNDTWAEVTTSTDTSYEYVQGDETFRIVWLYGKDGYTVTADANLPGSGTATRSPEPAGGLYFEGDEVTVTATAAEGYTFLEWRGDIPQGCDPASRSISFVVHHGVALTPVFVRNDGWVYLAKGDEGNPYDYGIVTDGNWVIKVSGKTDTYFTTASGAGQFVAGSGKLDVVQMESDLGIEWRLGSNATSVDYQKFKGVTAFTEVVLPARITTFSNETFAGCTNLVRFEAPGVTPLTNTGYFDGCTSLTTLSENFIHPNGNIGQAVFNNCSSLAVDFVCGPNVTSLGYHAFYKSGITSIDMSKANVSSVGNSFNDCPNLDKVILSTNCTAISGEVCLVDPTQVYATGACLSSVAWHSLGATDYRVRFFVDPVMDPAWKGNKIAGATVNAVTDTDRASSYYSEYGLAELEKAKRLLGVWAPGSGGKIWLIKWVSPCRKVGMKLIFK